MGNRLTFRPPTETSIGYNIDSQDYGKPPGGGDDGMNMRLTILEKSVGKLDNRVGSLERSVASMEISLIQLNKSVATLDKKMQNVENAFSSFKKWVTAVLLTSTALMIGIPTLYISWHIYDASKKYNAITQSLEKINQHSLQIDRLTIQHGATEKNRKGRQGHDECKVVR